MKKCVIIYKKNNICYNEYTTKEIRYAGFFKRLLKLNYKTKVGEL